MSRLPVRASLSGMPGSAGRSDFLGAEFCDAGDELGRDRLVEGEF